MATPATTRMFDPRRENVHPVFDPNRFAPDVDYYGAIYDSAVLATRLMNSPQALQHDYCFFYGKNVPANAPADYDRSEICNGNRPQQYACDKAIGELDQTDIRYVEQQRSRLAERVIFRVADLGETTFGMCIPCDPKEGVRGCNSVIDISRLDLYDKIVAPNPGQSPEDTIRVKFILACTMLHELAHAAHNHLFGEQCFEAFRENSNASEGGFEYESRIFGQRPELYLQAADPDNRIRWGIWQSHKGLPQGYDVDKLARHAWQMPKGPQTWKHDLEFVLKLFDDDFWEGDDSEYAILGAFALIPDEIALSCDSRKNSNMKKSIPLSIKDLFRDGGLSYAKKKYARFANPERKLRSPVEYDSCNQPIL